MKLTIYIGMDKWVPLYKNQWNELLKCEAYVGKHN